MKYLQDLQPVWGGVVQCATSRARSEEQNIKEDKEQAIKEDKIDEGEESSKGDTEEDLNINGNKADQIKQDETDEKHNVNKTKEENDINEETTENEDSHTNMEGEPLMKEGSEENQTVIQETGKEEIKDGSVGSDLSEGSVPESFGDSKDELMEKQCCVHRKSVQEQCTNGDLVKSIKGDLATESTNGDIDMEKSTNGDLHQKKRPNGDVLHEQKTNGELVAGGSNGLDKGVPDYPVHQDNSSTDSGFER